MRSIMVTLPDDMVALVDSKIASGDYVDESAVVYEGLLTLAEQDKALDRWLAEEVVPTYEAMKADPAQSMSLEDAFDGFRKHIDDVAARRKA